MKHCSYFESLFYVGSVFYGCLCIYRILFEQRLAHKELDDSTYVSILLQVHHVYGDLSWMAVFYLFVF